MFKKSKTKYKVVFLRKEYQTMNVVKILDVKKLSDTIKIGNRSFMMNWQNPSYNSGLTKIYFIDFVEGAQLVFHIVKSQLNPKELDLIVGNKIIKELTSGVLDNKATLIMYLIIGFIIGGLLASLIVMMVMQSKIDAIIDTTTLLPIPYLPTGG